MKRFLILISICLLTTPIFSQAWMQYLPTGKTESSLTFFDYQDAFKQWCLAKGIDNEGYFINSSGVRQKAYGWKQFKRWENEMQSMGRYNRQTGEMIRAEAMNRVLDEIRDPQGNTDNLSGNWVNLGYSETTGWSGGYYGVGRLNTIAFHPTNPDIFWVGAPRGGIWRTDDGGESWTPLSDNIAHIGISAIGIPSDYETSHTIYIGTGDRGHWSDLSIGLLKSTDGGNSWQSTSLTYENLSSHYISRILIHPDNNLIQYAGTNWGVDYTTNGWLTHTNVSSDRAIDMEFHPTRPDTLYVSTRDMDGLTYVKRSLDQGATWQTVLVKSGLRTEIAVSPDEPNWVYAIVSNNESGLEGIYRSTDAGATFQLQWDGSIMGHNLLGGDCIGWEEGGQGNYDLCIAVNPLDAQDVWIGGINMWRSVNAGVSWEIISHWSTVCGGNAQVVHADQHWLEFQNSSETIFTCNDGGVYRMEYGFNSFFDLSEGLCINQIYHLSNSQQDYDEIIMGLQDNSTVLWTDGDLERWPTGDGTNVLIHPADDDIQYYCAYSQYPRGTLDHWGMFLFSFSASNDSSTSWHKCFRVDPSNPEVLYWGLTNLWKSENYGIDFSLFCDPVEGGMIHDIAVSDSDPNVIVFANSTHLYRTSNGGTTWSVLTGSLPANCYPADISDIEIHHGNPNILWLSLATWSQNTVLESINGGVSWENVSAGIQGSPVVDIIQDDSHGTYPILYAAGFYGVHVKLGDQQWLPFNTGLPNVAVNELDIYYAGNKLRAGTWGRGFWESDFYSPEAGMQAIWTGIYNTDWNDYRNWLYMEVPGVNSDVVIPSGCVRNPHIYTGNVTCKNLVVEDGMSLNISGYELTVNENIEIHGALRMHVTNSKLTIHGDISWESGSSFVNTGTDPSLNVAGDWTFKPGAAVDLTGSETRFFGNVSSNLYLNDEDCDFGQIKVDKTAPASVYYSATSSANMDVQNDFVVTSTGKFYQQSNKMLTVTGNLDAQGAFFQQNGTYRCNNGSTILMSSVSYFDTLLIDHSLFTVLLSDIEVRGQLYLKSGLLNIYSHELDLLGDLKRQTEGSISMTTGKVVMMGNNEQKIYSDLYIANVEIDNISDTLRIMDGADVVIDSLDWTNGGFSLNTGSSLTINELADDGIWGGYCVRPGATLNLSNPTGSVNLNGNLLITGGSVNVYGGSTGSYWPDAANAGLQMTSGTLDFKDVGIFVRYHPTYTFTDNITGGVIRTSGDFMGDHTGFNPSGGVIELYGPDNAGLGHGTGSNFYKVLINKGSTSDEPDFLAGSDADRFKGSARYQKVKPPTGGPAHKKTPPPSGTRANKVTVYDNLDIDNQLVVTSGILDINGKTVNVASNVDISGTLTMTSGTSVLNAGTNITWFPGSWANITAGTLTFKSNWQFMSGTNAYLSGTSTVKAIGTSISNVYHKDPDACFANFTAEKASNSVYLDNVSLYPMRVNGNLTVKNGSTLRVSMSDLIVGGTFLTESTASVQLQSDGTIQSNNCIFKNTINLVNGTSLTTNGLSVEGTLNLTDGGAVTAEYIDLIGTLDMNAGSVTIHNDFTNNETGHLIIDGGSFIIDAPYTASTVGFAGITDLNGGFFEISYKSVKFSTGAITNILAGTFRVGGDFLATQSNAFKPAIGAVEFINTHGSSIQCTNGNYFYDLTINKSAGANPCSLADTIYIQNDLNIQSGQLNSASKTIKVMENLTIQAQGVLGAESAKIYVGDEWINNHGTNGFLEGISDVYLISSQTCTLPSESFYTLELRKTTGFNQFVEMAAGSTLNILNKLIMTDGTLRMSQNSTLNLIGDLHIKPGAGLNANAFVTGTTLNCNGYWLDENTSTSTQVGFHSGQSTVNITGSDIQEMTANDTVTFYNLNMQKTGGSFKPATTITVLGDYHHSSGVWSYSATGLTYDFEGDFTISSPSLWQDQVNTVTFTGTSSQSITNSDVGYLNFSLMEVTKPEAEVLTINSDLSLSNRLIINSGVAEVENHRLMCQNGLDVYTGGEINLTGDVSAYMGTDGQFRIQGGDFNIAGTANQRAHVTRASSGYYEFVVESGGTVTAEYTDFEYINNRGLQIYIDGNIGSTQPLLYCSFQQGESGGTLLQINNAQDIVLHNVNFPANTWSGTSNVRKTNDAGNVTMANATGNFAGPDYENDEFGRIHWPAVGIWDGDISTEWHDARNWWYDIEYPNGSTDVVIPAGVTHFPEYHLVESHVNSLKILPGANLTITKDTLFVNTWADIAGQINFGDEEANTTAMFCDSIIFKSGSSANVIGRGAFYIYGNMFISRGSDLNDTQGAWYFTGNDDSRLICHDTARINNLYNFKNSGYSLDLEGDTLAQLTCSLLSIGAGAYLRCPSSQEWVLNAYLRNTDGGHIRLQNGTLRIKGNQLSYFRPNDGDYFNNLILETTALVNLNNTYSDTLRIKGNLVINQGTTGTSGIQANAFKILVWGDWVNNVGTTAFSAGTSKVVFMDPSVPQNVQGNTSFYNLTAGDWETSAVNFYGQNTIANIFESWFATNVYGTLNANQVYSDNDFAYLNVYDGGAATFSTFQQGAPVHVYDGTFTVTDLFQDYVTGSYTIDEGLISLGQTYSPTASHDLYYANITINGGELRFTGGNGVSLWPRTPGAASVTMSDGVFDLTNQNVEIKPTGFTENITGGTLRIPFNFYGGAGVTAFHPTGGVVEFYDISDADCGFFEESCWFYDVHVNKDEAWVFPYYRMRIKNELRLVSGHLVVGDGNPVTVGP